MNLTYKEIFLQQKNLQQTLYGKFGYKIDSMSQIVEKKKKNDHYPVTANIKLRKVAQSLYKNQRIQQVDKEIEDLRKDRKRRQEQQSKATKNTPTLNYQDTNNYMQKMQHIISHYNYLIDHKHIKQKDSQQARKMLNIQPKTQSQKAIEEINQLKEKLLKTTNIQQQFLLNRRINQLYKLFKEKVDERVGGRRRAVSERVKEVKENEKTQQSTFRVMSRMYQESRRASSIASRFDQHYYNTSINPNNNKPTQKHMLNLTMAQSHQPQIYNTQKYESNSMNKSLLQETTNLRKIKSHNAAADYQVEQLQQNDKIQVHPQSFIRRELQVKSENELIKEKKKNQQLQKSILEPYVSKEFIQNGKKLDVKIKNNCQALQLWKGRISQALPPSSSYLLNIKSKHSLSNDSQANFKQRRQQEKFYNRINDTVLELKQHILYNNNNNDNKNVLINETVEGLKIKNARQEEILSGLLEKKNCKYLRPWGTKILVKYNAAKQAKDMLGLSPTKDSRQPTLNQTAHNSQLGFASTKPLDDKNKLNLSLSFKQNNQATQQQQQQQQVLDWNNEIDQQYYWTMCKNEKINLLLKGKRRR